MIAETSNNDQTVCLDLAMAIMSWSRDETVYDDAENAAVSDYLEEE